MIWLRRTLIALGAVIIVIAFRGVWTAISGPDLRHYLRYLIVGWLANDLFVLPLVICAGWLLSRWLPPAVKPVVQGAMLSSLVVTAVGYAMIIGKGFSADNPSALPRDYRLGLAVTLGAIWLTATLIIGWRHQRRRHLPPDTTSPPSSRPDPAPPASETTP